MAHSVVAVGIDLGTTNSCVAVVRVDGKVDIVANNNTGSRTTPSCVSFDQDGEILVGDAAKEMKLRNPGNTVYEIKRLIGRKFSDEAVQDSITTWPFNVVNVGNSPNVEIDVNNLKTRYSPEKISAIILKEMEKIAKTYLCKDITDVVITVPARFNNTQREATKDAGKIAGLNVVHIINEPTAAALAYGFDKTMSNMENILVYDLGGGTFDVAILTVANGEFTVRGSGGDTALGGSDFDNRILKYLLEFIEKTKNIDLKTDKRAVAKLKKASETAKISLSSAEKATINIDCLIGTEDFKMVLTRRKFEELCQDLFSRTTKLVEDVLSDAKLKKTDIHEIVLAGGSTRIPKIQELLVTFFEGKQLNQTIHADEAVAYGAAIKARSTTGNFTGKEIKLVDTTPHSIGIRSGDGKMVVCIGRNISMPTKQTSTWTTFHRDQTELEFCLYEGENPCADMNTLIGKFSLTGISKAKRGVPRIDVTFGIDSNGIANVYAEDTLTGLHNEITIKSDRGRLTDTEIQTASKEVAAIKFG